jgi:hypothetical protein
MMLLLPLIVDPFANSKTDDFSWPLIFLSFGRRRS